MNHIIHVFSVQRKLTTGFFLRRFFKLKFVWIKLWHSTRMSQMQVKRNPKEQNVAIFLESLFFSFLTRSLTWTNKQSNGVSDDCSGYFCCLLSDQSKQSEFLLHDEFQMKQTFELRFYFHRSFDVLPLRHTQFKKLHSSFFLFDFPPKPITITRFGSNTNNRTVNGNLCIHTHIRNICNHTIFQLDGVVFFRTRLRCYFRHSHRIAADKRVQTFIYKL